MNFPARYSYGINNCGRKQSSMLEWQQKLPPQTHPPPKMLAAVYVCEIIDTLGQQDSGFCTAFFRLLNPSIDLTKIETFWLIIEVETGIFW